MVSRRVRSLRQTRLESAERLRSAFPMSRLGPAGQARLLEEGEYRSVTEGDVVYAARAPATHLILLLRGALQIEAPNDGIRGQAVAMVRGVYLLGEAQVLTGRPFSGTGVALTPAELLSVRLSLLETLIRTEPEFALAYAKEIAHRFLLSIDARKTLFDTTPEERVLSYVLSLQQIRTLEGYTGALPIRQSDLAQATGLRRETVNKVLKRLVARELLAITPGRIRCLAPERVGSGLALYQPAFS